MGSKNSMLKKLVASLTNKIDKLKLRASEIKNENDSLHVKNRKSNYMLKKVHWRK